MHWSGIALQPIQCLVMQRIANAFNVIACALKAMNGFCSIQFGVLCNAQSVLESVLESILHGMHCVVHGEMHASQPAFRLTTADEKRLRHVVCSSLCMVGL